MIELYRDRESARIGHLSTVLEAAGIATFVRNENLSILEVSIPTFLPALCVVNEEDYPRAVEILQEHLQRAQVPVETERICGNCGEKCPGNFEVCWNCGGPLTEPSKPIGPDDDPESAAF